MKKTLAMVLALALMLGTFACAGTPAAETTPTDTAAAEATEPVAEATEAPVDPATLSGTITVWSSGEELTRFVEGFNAVYPNIKVEVTVVPNAEFLTKLSTAISGGQAPDLFTGESDYVKYLVETPYWADLSQFGADQYKDNVWEYVWNIGTDSKGVTKALSWQASPGGVIYRRDIAKTVLGTDDPAAVGEMLNSNAKMMEVAAKMAQNGVKMFATWQDIMNMEFTNRAGAWVTDGQLSIDANLLEYMDMAKSIVDNGYDKNCDPWSGEWYAAVESSDCFCYILPTWGYQFLIKPSAVTTSGQWAMCEAPVPYVKGGTWVGIYDGSQNKELAWLFLQYCTLNEDSVKAYASQYGEYVALKSVDEALAKEQGDAVLGGQNLYEFYNGVMAKIPADLMTQYDGTLNNAFLSAVKSYVSGAMTKDEAIAQFKADALNAYPDLTIAE
ncbi:MAG: extracellular solute-binding protein [Eubacteriales bacterium]|nr:extracellular solute-binding protein [Eubacteriales bacterium]